MFAAFPPSTATPSDTILSNSDCARTCVPRVFSVLSVSKHSVSSGPGSKFIERHTKTRSLYADNNGKVRKENAREEIRKDVNWIKPAKERIQHKRRGKAV
jgi:hypothetical protein